MPHEPTLDSDGGAPDPYAAPDGEDRWIGNYRILRNLGEGGMGAVYLAEQASPRRTVALKLVRPGLASERTLKRFELEGQVLGLLHHPSIAKIFESGTADAGAGPQPYFAMEFIRGQDLCGWSRLHPRRAVLEQLIAVCDAVQHAHQKGIIHRDLKPDNILVDAEGRAHILDFGLARVTDPDRQTTEHTEAGQVLGTLPYMSPEQARAARDLDASTDVYSLGVILFECLAGQRPLDLTGLPYHEATRILEQEEPRRLGAVDRSLRGDLETITHKALEKERRRRYASAADLADDLRRFLDDRPIRARAPSRIDRSIKLFRRHRALVSSLSALFVVLAVATGISLFLSLKATRAEGLANTRLGEALAAETRAEQRAREAELAARRAGTVRDFLEELLRQARPDHSLGSDVTVLEVLGESEKLLAENPLDADPITEISVRQTLGTTFEGLGKYPQALQHLERALHLAREIELEPAERATVERQVGNTLNLLDRTEEAQTLAESALASHEQLLGENSYEIAEDIELLSRLAYRRGETDRAIGYRRRQEAILEAIYGPDGLPLCSLHNELALYYLSNNQVEESARSVNRARELAERHLAERHPLRLSVESKQVDLLLNRRDFDAAEKAARELYAKQVTVYGEKHPNPISTLWRLGNVLVRSNREDEAEPLVADVVRFRRELLGPHSDLATALGLLAEIRRGLGELESAETLALESLAMRRAVLGDDSPALADSLHRLGTVTLAKGDAGLACEQIEEAVRRFVAAPGDHRMDLASARMSLGRAQRLDEEYDASVETLKGVVAFRRESGDRFGILASRHEVAESLIAGSRFQEALEWIDATLALSSLDLPASFRSLLAVQRCRILGAMGDCDQRAELEQQARAVVHNAQLLRVNRNEAAVHAANFYADCGDAEQAEGWRAQIVE